MKKIYFIREKLIYHGGAENYLSRLMASLREHRIDFQVINSDIPKFLPSWMRLILFNLKLVLIKRNKLFFSLERIVCPDIYRAGDGVHKVFLQIEKKTIFNPLHFIMLRIEKKCFNKAKIIIANSKMVKNDIISSYSINPKKIEVIYNGYIPIKEKFYESSYSKIAKEFNIQANQKVILYVGSGYKRKGVSEFLEILSKLKNNNFIAFVVGKEKRLKNYISLADSLLLSKKVHFVGARKDVENFFILSDIFVLPSHYEPFGNVVLEAMSYGNVVFTTKKTGASELLDEEFIMTTPKDFSVVKKIDNYLKRPRLLKEIKQKNIKISKNFSVEKNRVETLRVINKYFND